ncbi:hypothetical protein D6D12_10706 [Aureobasidium pullulans]|uniref:Uncharacterized protein n=1 Tax=Aureobasidium pullulans TaxID=5580 RepID=A0AB74JCQ3_AURPU|nr:hypothetical protein D6D12_10706 [Aureobasidium pullulans]
MNKGHEAMAYLTFLVDNYDTLPSTIAFLHSHRDGFLRAWHTDAPLHDNVYAMQHLQLDFVHHSGYVNLRCKWNPGCLRSHSGIIHVTLKIWQAVFANTSTPPPSLDPQTAEQIVPFPMPSKIGVACCAQFVVSREQVYKRPREDYVIFRDWVADTELNDAHSGRVMEYLWHIIFAADAVQMLHKIDRLRPVTLTQSSAMSLDDFVYYRLKLVDGIAVKRILQQRSLLIMLRRI